MALPRIATIRDSRARIGVNRRASSLVTFVNRLPTNTSLLVLTFWGGSLTSLSPSKTPLLSRLSEWSPAARASLQQDLLAHGTNREGTLTFVPLLSALHEVLAADLAKGGSADYELVLVTDGSPSDEDQSLFCGTAVTGLTALGNAKNSVRLSIGHVFHIKQAVPPCTDSIDVTACKVTPPASMCAAGVLAADIARLSKVAALGTGTFTSFEGTTQVDYSALVTR